MQFRPRFAGKKFVLLQSLVSLRVRETTNRQHHLIGRIAVRQVLQIFLSQTKPHGPFTSLSPKFSGSTGSRGRCDLSCHGALLIVVA